MPNKWTFVIKPNQLWIDPFCGKNSPAQLTNDLNPEIKADTHKDALEWLSSFDRDSVDGIIYDPPYSHHQIVTTYKSKGKIKASLEKDEISRVIKPGGKAICFGWNSNGIGKKRGFKMIKIILICHGAEHNDTIITVERKINNSLF